MCTSTSAFGRFGDRVRLPHRHRLVDRDVQVDVATAAGAP
jgi:hypothetical protein